MTPTDKGSFLTDKNNTSKTFKMGYTNYQTKIVAVKHIFVKKIDCTHLYTLSNA